MTASALLELEGVHTHIGPYHILHGVDLTVPEGEVTVLLGRNGAGKTTTLRTVMGLWRASRGEIRLRGEPIHGRDTPDIARAGLAYVPENMGVFADLTVQENMVLAARAARHASELDPARLQWVFGLFPALRRFWLHPRASSAAARSRCLPWRAPSSSRVRSSSSTSPARASRRPSWATSWPRCGSSRRSAPPCCWWSRTSRWRRAVGDTVAVMDDGRIVHRGSMAGLAADEALQQRLLGPVAGGAP
jgi:branched-chain amino acid transport system ATP-binding protein